MYIFRLILGLLVSGVVGFALVSLLWPARGTRKQIPLRIALGWGMGTAVTSGAWFVLVILLGYAGTVVLTAELSFIVLSLVYLYLVPKAEAKDIKAAGLPERFAERLLTGR